VWIGIRLRLTSQNIVIILLYLILTSVLISCEQSSAINIPSSNSTESGPTISRPSEAYRTMFFDGAYTGQSQEVFEWSGWVNDSSGVDSVVYRFKWDNDENWLNRTAVLVEGDEFRGRYEGNLTWPAPGGGKFQFKIFANDTLGYWNETIPMTVHYGYLYWDPIYTPQFWFFFSQFFL